MHLDTDFMLFIQINSTWIIDLKMKDKTIKLLRKAEETLHDLW